MYPGEQKGPILRAFCPWLLRCPVFPPGSCRTGDCRSAAVEISRHNKQKCRRKLKMGGIFEWQESLTCDKMCRVCGPKALPVKSSQESLPKYIEQDTKQGPSSQFAERPGSGLKACPSSMELRGLGVRAQVRVWAFLSLSFFLLRGFPRSCLPHAARRVAAHRGAVHGLGKRTLSHSLSFSI